ncbi:TIM barrel protein [Larsenimonas salina]|uniref:TIM barrel protein n=1 Tax=Larsenimonas salina TaxID=1295565 RepID=UPI002072B5B4|nr:TIM barrel protein [Larsenimonas salina]MCM5705220.1 TIM barrel protein [Larsenimonas salina]
MSGQTPRFALNHMICPSISAKKLVDGAVDLGLDAIELRNDIGENSILTLEQARAAGDYARERGIRVLTINALYPFNIWNDERAEQAEAMAQLAKASGAEALILCPLVDAEHGLSEQQQHDHVVTALKGLDGIFERNGIRGLVEPLGFPISSLRTKQAATAAIKELNLEHRFSVVHDTFHHRGADESACFPEMTGLVHISGVEDKDISFNDMLDDHRVLVGPEDRLGNVEQIRDLMEKGYTGYFSFEPFSKPVWDLPDPLAATKESLEFIRSSLNK